MPELLQTSAAVDRENPWPGLASFTEDSRAFFFGRENGKAFLHIVRQRLFAQNRFSCVQSKHCVFEVV